MRRVDEAMLAVIRNQQCIRRTVLMYLKVEGWIRMPLKVAAVEDFVSVDAKLFL